MPSPPFTAEDKAFLTAILNQPAELTAWLAYADWLDERDQPQRAEYLRLIAGLGPSVTDTPEARERVDRLRELRAKIHPNWTAVFDRPQIENCQLQFAFECPKRWENLKVTGEARVRHCDQCQEPVYYCEGIAEARQHAQLGRCVAVSLGIKRREGDLSPPRNFPPGAEVSPVPSQPLDLAGVQVISTLGILERDPTSPPPPRRPWWKFW